MAQPSRDLVRREDFRVVRSEHFGQHCVWRVDRFDQPRNLRRHHEEVPSLGVPGVPIGMRRAPRSDNRGAGWRSNLQVTETKAELPFQDVPRFVVSVMDVKRRDPVYANLRRPFHDHEVAARDTERAAR